MIILKFKYFGINFDKNWFTDFSKKSKKIKVNLKQNEKQIYTVYFKIYYLSEIYFKFFCWSFKYRYFSFITALKRIFSIFDLNYLIHSLQKLKFGKN